MFSEKETVPQPVPAEFLNNNNNQLSTKAKDSK